MKYDKIWQPGDAGEPVPQTFRRLDKEGRVVRPRDHAYPICQIAIYRAFGGTFHLVDETGWNGFEKTEDALLVNAHGTLGSARRERDAIIAEYEED